ncbi:MAG TPA: ABC transporter permease [Micrococcales bacterium]|uniref:ABC transporter permease n=1 Tax=Miniimonas arenae TaxID=676201 RepID=UPI000ECDF6ED|nr:ABC transporter permease subunit [Miniimonas arenae]HCX86320.1 ABC transporter permease [Micrococcales bacterium]
MRWALDNLGLLGQLTIAHARLAIVPVAVALLLALPLGALAHRVPALRGTLLGLAGLLYTIPSLALFVLLPPMLGIPYLSDLNVIIALTLYALALLVRTVTEALESVPPDAVASARAIGYNGTSIFLAVQLPLAGPVLLAGLRVATVSTVSMVTVGALIGVSSLGSLFTDGLQRRIVPEVLTGVVLTALLALLLDVLLQLAGRVLMPWLRAERAVATA